MGKRTTHYLFGMTGVLAGLCSLICFFNGCPSFTKCTCNHTSFGDAPDKCFISSNCKDNTFTSMIVGDECLNYLDVSTFTCWVQVTGYKSVSADAKIYTTEQSNIIFYVLVGISAITILIGVIWIVLSCTKKSRRF